MPIYAQSDLQIKVCYVCFREGEGNGHSGTHDVTDHQEQSSHHWSSLQSHLHPVQTGTLLACTQFKQVPS